MRSLGRSYLHVVIVIEGKGIVGFVGSTTITRSRLLLLLLTVITVIMIADTVRIGHSSTRNASTIL